MWLVIFPSLCSYVRCLRGYYPLTPAIPADKRSPLPSTALFPQEPEASPRIGSLKEGNSSILHERAYSQHTGTLDAGAALGNKSKVCREL